MAGVISSSEIPESLRLLTVPEVVAMTGLGRSTLYAAMLSGKLRKTKIGGAARIRMSDLRAFVEAAAA